VLKKYKDKEEIRGCIEKGKDILKSKLPYVLQAVEEYKGALKERMEEKTEVERKEIDATQTKVEEIITKFDELLKELDC
jgi:thymidylate synthase ThyX